MQLNAVKQWGSMSECLRFMDGSVNPDCTTSKRGKHNEIWTFVMEESINQVSNWKGQNHEAVTLLSDFPINKQKNVDDKSQYIKTPIIDY